MAEYVIENITSDNNLTLSADNEILVSKTPVSDFGIATKKYVDDNIADINGSSLGTGEDIFVGKQGNNLRFRSLSISGLLNIISTLDTISISTNSDVVDRNSSQVLTNKTLTDSTNDISANKLRTSSGDINISGNTPSVGQVLVAQSSNNALWQNINPSGTSEIYNAINQKITTEIEGKWKKIKFDTEIIRTSAFNTLSSGTWEGLIINEEGNYIVQIDVSLMGTTGNSRSGCYVRFMINGIEVLGTRRIHYIRQNDYGDSSSIIRYISFNSGDIIYIEAIRYAGSTNIITIPNGCSIFIKKI